MKAITLVLSLLLLPLFFFAQWKSVKGTSGSEYNIYFEIEDSSGTIGIATPYLHNPGFVFGQTNGLESSGVYNGVLLGVGYKDGTDVVNRPQYEKSLSKRYRIFSVLDSSSVKVIAYGITPENSSYFKYHIIQNDKTELVNWRMPTVFEQKYDAEHPYAVLWEGGSLNNQIYVEAYDTRNYGSREGVVLNWSSKVRNLPSVIETEGLVGSFEGDNRVLSPYKFNKDSINSPFFSGYDTCFNVPKKLHYQYGEVANIIFRFNLELGMCYNVQVVKVNDDSTREIRYFDVDRSVEWFAVDEYLLSGSGKYEIKIYNSNGRKDDGGDIVESIIIPVEVFPPTTKLKTFTIKQIASYTVAAILMAAFLFYMYKRKVKGKIANAEVEKKISKLRLQSVRSQLNPHFVYNALAGIQNLLGKKDNESANEYLARFARLSRRALEDADKDLITVEDEVKLLTDYLQMEQMRFSFAYSILVGDNLDQINTQIPAMLLQPFVENAVKHAIPTVKNGYIEVKFDAVGSSILIEIRDNGNGFDVGTASGAGSLLSKERVSLLNELFIETPVVLDFSSGKGGTKITLKLKDWLA